MIITGLLATAFAIATGDVITTERGSAPLFDPFEHFHTVNVYTPDLQYRDTVKAFRLTDALPTAVATVGDAVYVAEFRNVQGVPATTLTRYDAAGNSRTLDFYPGNVVALRPWGNLLFAAFPKQIGEIDPASGWLISTRTVDTNESITDLDLDERASDAFITTDHSVLIVDLRSGKVTTLLHDETDFFNAIRLLRDGDLLVAGQTHLLRLAPNGFKRNTIDTVLDVDRGACKLALTPDGRSAVAACGWHIWSVDLGANRATVRGVLHDATAPTGVTVRDEWRPFAAPKRQRTSRH